MVKVWIFLTCKWTSGGYQCGVLLQETPYGHCCSCGRTFRRLWGPRLSIGWSCRALNACIWSRSLSDRSLKAEILLQIPFSVRFAVCENKYIANIFTAKGPDIDFKLIRYYCNEASKYKSLQDVAFRLKCCHVCYCGCDCFCVVDVHREFLVHSQQRNDWAYSM